MQEESFEEFGQSASMSKVSRAGEIQEKDGTLMCSERGRKSGIFMI